MSLRVQSLNSDTTFVLTFTHPALRKPFVLLLDPWLHSSPYVYHPLFSNQSHTTQPCISSISQLSPVPDMIIVSQKKMDHCDEGTLKELDWKSAAKETLLYAAPEAARVVSRWKWLDQKRLRVLRQGKTMSVELRNGDEKHAAGDSAGWLELSYLAPKRLWELPALHNAIGIKWVIPRQTEQGNQIFSILFSPHGAPVAALRPWLSTLPSRTQIPKNETSTQTVSPQQPNLSLLVHPFSHIHSLLGGEIISGFPGGISICRHATVDNWISAHDEAKDVRGITAGFLRYRLWDVNKVKKDLKGEGIEGVRVNMLQAGEEVDIELC
ncbi:hypothetical protein L873DRAFT_1792246 [Choiromyces venosus 120613-1]|uniref:Metallo-beta-lactamase domain-containing protein n=1 Tax=Choiromyces venosus 120613-1 TaxID=1336337 RepID=A0A3N4JNN4_9PEZI|nr:hypothetical protein L873DRAFT_1792246 [Choiromyces venosus 120613-1]